MRNNQAGGIVSFVVVGLVLVGLLAGGLYYSKSQGRTARENGTSAPQVVIEKPAPKETAKPEAKQESPKTTNDTGRTAPSGNNPQQNQNSTTRPAPGATNQVATTGPSDAIPATGPGETVAAVIVLAVLSFTSFRLIQSRRDLHRSALRR